MAIKPRLFFVESDGPRPITLPPGIEAAYDIYEAMPGGVYTSLCTFEHNRFLHLEDHLTRLDNSIDESGWDYELDRWVLRKALHQVCTDFPGQNARVRLDILARPAIHLGSESRILITLSDFEGLPPDLYRKGVRVGITRGLSRNQPLIKKSEFARQRRAILARDPSLYECLLLDRDGHLLEGTTSNFYAMRDKALFTAGEGILEGIARLVVLHVAEELNIPVVFSPVHKDEISRLEEAAMSSSSRALIPVVEIAGQQVADGHPGPMTQRILAAYRSYLGSEIRLAIED